MSDSHLDTIRTALKMAYLLLYILLVILTLVWNSDYIIFVTLMTLGLPIFFMVSLPLIGLQMYRLKSLESMVLSLVYSLLPLVYIISELQTFPFIRPLENLYAGEAISLELSWAILSIYILFSIVTLLSFYFCLKSYHLKKENALHKNL